jgi:hypothetical protein
MFPLEYLDERDSFGKAIKFLIFETFFTKISHPVQAMKPPKVKKLKIGVARKLDLIGPNQVYSYSSFIRLYQSHIVRPILYLGCWTVLLKMTSLFSYILNSIDFCISLFKFFKIFDSFSFNHYL